MKKRNGLWLLLWILAACNTTQPDEKKPAKAEVARSDDNKIKVLNFGTFHMGMTTDAKSTEYDEYSQKNREEVQQVAAMLSAFKPTVIVVETVPESNKGLQKEFEGYKSNPDIEFEYPTEIELLAFEVGRISGVSRLYGIDHKMDYDYSMVDSLAKALRKETYLEYMKTTTFLSDSSFTEGNTLVKLTIMNQPRMLDFLIEVNADILTHVATDSNFEGADEAAKYYHRNLRMYSNLNQLPLTRQDRVFLLMGASHTAFFRDFMSRSPVYEMVDTFEYLK